MSLCIWIIGLPGEYLDSREKLKWGWNVGAGKFTRGEISARQNVHSKKIARGKIFLVEITDYAPGNFGFFSNSYSSYSFWARDTWLVKNIS